MALVLPSPLSLSPCPSKNPRATFKHFKLRQAISKYNINANCLSSLSSRNQNPICKYEGLDHTHLTRKTREVKISQNSSASEYGARRFGSSNMVMQRVKDVFYGRKWNAIDIRNLCFMVVVHGLALFAPFYFNWRAFWLAFWLYIATGIGVTLSFHRNLSHKSFKLPKWLEYFWAYMGVLAVQDDPITWVSNHRYHHQYCDSERDVHSPLEGFWFSHINWLFDTGAITKKCGGQSNVRDLEKQPFYRLMRSTYYFQISAFAALLYFLGGFPYLVWGMGVRIVCGYHAIFFVNSVSHMWGTRVWNTRDMSKNNWLVALATFGEGWHNNHHAFEYSARHGLEWWQIDMTWYTIKLFQVLGLAKDVKLPTKADKQRLSLKN